MARIDFDDILFYLGFPGLIVLGIIVFATASQINGQHQLKKAANITAWFAVSVGVSLILLKLSRMTGFYFYELKVLSYILTFVLAVLGISIGLRMKALQQLPVATFIFYGLSQIIMLAFCFQAFMLMSRKLFFRILSRNETEMAMWLILFGGVVALVLIRAIASTNQNNQTPYYGNQYPNYPQHPHYPPQQHSPPQGYQQPPFPPSSQQTPPSAPKIPNSNPPLPTPPPAEDGASS